MQTSIFRTVKRRLVTQASTLLNQASGDRAGKPASEGLRLSSRFASPALALILTALLSSSLFLGAGRTASAQVLARPGWAGSGVTPEPWWHRAVFYRIDPVRFQDGTGQGRGNPAGIIQRLGYLQSLGVDALVLDFSAPDLNPRNTKPASSRAGSTLTATSLDGFDDLTREAVSHHLRVLIALGAPASQGSAAMGQYLAQARAWLNQGAAGIYVSTRPLAAFADPGLATYLVAQLRGLTNSFPGDRILVADAVPDAPAALQRAIAQAAQLTVAPALSLAAPDAASLRQQMLARLAGAPGTATLLLASRQMPPSEAAPQERGLERAAAAILLASRTAVMIDYGQELGERGPETQPGMPRSATIPIVGSAGAVSRQGVPLEIGSGGSGPLMQWTPTNLTREPKAPEAESAATKPAATYGAFHSYVKPLPRNLFTPPPLPDVVLSDTPSPVDPNSLPGFTSGNIDPVLAAAAARNAATANVAVEDADPNSLLNLYRRLIQLHHENASVRNGAEDVLDYDSVDALVWLRQAPAGSRTSAAVLVACNLSVRPLALSLSSIAQLHMRRGALRNLLSVATLSSSASRSLPQAASDLSVAPGHLFIGELHP